MDLIMECCGNCKYNQVDKDVVEQRAFICTNELSNYYGDYTNYDHYCMDYERKNDERTDRNGSTNT